MISLHKMEEIIGIVLILGILFSAGFVLIGGILFLLQHGGDNFQMDLMNTSYQHNIKQIWSVLSFSPIGLIELGLLSLVTTQILRVALLAGFYIAQRDYWFTVISFFILLVLVYSFFVRQ